MNHEEEQEYQEKMGSPEMEYLQYQMEHPEMTTKHQESWKERFDEKFGTFTVGSGKGEIATEQTLKSFIKETLEAERERIEREVKEKYFTKDINGNLTDTCSYFCCSQEFCTGHTNEMEELLSLINPLDK